MAPLWSSQPFKAVYVVFLLLKAPPYAGLLFLKYLAKRFRPVPEWSPSLNLTAAMARTFFQYVATTRSQRTLFADPTKAGKQHARIEPPAAYLFSGVLASETIKPEPVDAVWFPGPLPLQNDILQQKSEKVVLHFPGGAFIMAFGYKDTGRDVEEAMTKYLKATRTIWAQYRLSGKPETRFPAAIQDALTFYQYVLSLGIDPKNVVLSGDSAGGNVVLGLLRYLEASQNWTHPLPLPSGVIAFSPWVHVTPDAGDQYIRTGRAKTDVLASDLLQWGADAYLPEGELSSEVQAYTSPLHHPFKLSVPLFLHDGAAEGFHDDIQTFGDEMVQLNGDRVRVRSTPLGPHDMLLSHKGFGLTDPFRVELEEAREFFEHGA